MRILILVVNDARKKYSSTLGMKRSVETSELLKHRVKNVVPKQIEGIIKAIKERNFDTFARITMQDSNSIHAVCLDTFPPCVYMNDISHMIVNMVHDYNAFKHSNKVRYIKSLILLLIYLAWLNMLYCSHLHLNTCINFRLHIHLTQDQTRVYTCWNLW